MLGEIARPPVVATPPSRPGPRPDPRPTPDPNPEPIPRPPDPHPDPAPGPHPPKPPEPIPEIGRRVPSKSRSITKKMFEARPPSTSSRRPWLAMSAAAVLAIGWIACSAEESQEARDASSTGRSVEVVAELQPTAGNEARGMVRFRRDGEGVLMTAELEGLPPGVHAFHVHEKGDCSAPDASSAGPHYAFAPTSDPPERITGNLGELEADEDGRARREARIPLARLDGPRSIVGRSVVVHERGNDPTSPPAGDAGGRIACGVIRPGI